MDLFGLNRFIGGPDRDAPPQRGAARWFQALWDNLGGLLGGNLLTFAGCLPLALGISLGLVYENLWITLISGAAGGALAGIVWVPMLSLAFQAFQGGTQGWLGRWRQAVLRAPRPAAGIGVLLGLLSGGLLLAGSFLGQLLAQGGSSPLLVWMILAVDFFLLSLAAVLILPVICVLEKGKKIEGHAVIAFFTAAPGRICAAAAGTLIWFALEVAIFPVSVPPALVLGFWPPALLTAQLTLPALAERIQMPQWEPESYGGPKGHFKRAGEIWWRRRGPVVVIAAAVIGLLLWGGNQLFTAQEPDLQIAVVHAQPLPDGVLSSLEHSLAELVGDQNGDGTARVQVNDYTVVFDGSAANADLQTAGSTLLVTDVAAGVSSIYLAEDVDGFLAQYADKVNGEQAALWQACPALSELDAGSYSALEDMDHDVSGQSLLAELTVLPSLSAEDWVLELLD